MLGKVLDSLGHEVYLGLSPALTPPEFGKPSLVAPQIAQHKSSNGLARLRRYQVNIEIIQVELCSKSLAMA